MDQHTSIAHRVAPEDLRRGMYVAVLSITHELLPLFCESAWLFERSEPCRMAFWPDAEETGPVKIIAVCLPFVLVKEAQGRVRTMDVRRHRLAVVTEEFGRTCFKRVRAVREARKGRKKSR